MKKFLLLMVGLVLFCFAGNAQNTATAPKHESSGNSLNTLNTFPVYVNKGNEVNDARTYELEKGKWIEQNQEAYRAMIQKSPVEKELPGFPVYIHTGDVQKDAQVYKAAKDKWISENKELYEAYLKKISENASYQDEEVEKIKMEKLNKNSNHE